MVDVALSNAKLIPDLIDEAPQNVASVNWTESNAVADLGNEVTPRQMKDVPVVSWNAEPDAFYTLLMVDPESTIPEFVHWLVVNIPGNDLNSGEVKSVYVGSGARLGTGFHRYTFLVFRQTEKKSFADIPFVPKHSRAGRAGFNTKEFIKANELSISAANFIRAQYDDYVPEVHKQFTIL